MLKSVSHYLHSITSLSHWEWQWHFSEEQYIYLFEVKATWVVRASVCVRVNIKLLL